MKRVALFLFLFPSAASACLFEANALGLTRSMRLDVAIYVDGAASGVVVHHESRYAVDYDAQISARGVPRLTKLVVRPRVTVSDRRTALTIEGGLQAWVLGGKDFDQREPPELAYVRGGFVIDGEEVATGIAGGIFPGGPVVETAPLSRAPSHINPDGDGWVAAVIGPSLDGVNKTIVAAEFAGSRYELVLTGYGWAESRYLVLRAVDSLCSGDFNADGAVDQGDIDMVLLDWGRGPGEPRVGDWRHEVPDRVNQSALDAVLIAWGDVSPAKLMGTGAVPEPTSMLLALCVVVCWHFSRQRRCFLPLKSAA